MELSNDELLTLQNAMAIMARMGGKKVAILDEGLSSVEKRKKSAKLRNDKIEQAAIRTLEKTLGPSILEYIGYQVVN